MKSLSRRQFALAAAAPFLVRAQSGPLRARIKVDTERTIGDIDPLIEAYLRSQIGEGRGNGRGK